MLQQSRMIQRSTCIEVQPSQRSKDSVVPGAIQFHVLVVFNEPLPDGRLRLVGQGRVGDGDMDSALESLVKVGLAIGRKEEDALEVFKLSEEDWHWVDIGMFRCVCRVLGITYRRRLRFAPSRLSCVYTAVYRLRREARQNPSAWRARRPGPGGFPR
jgi:hypothetical protein